MSAPMLTVAPSARVVAGTEDLTRRYGRLLLGLSVLLWAASAVIGFRTPLAVLTVVGFGAAMAGVFRPQLGLLGIGLLCTLDAPDRNFLFTGGLWRWNTLNYWLLVVLAVFLPIAWRWRGATIRLLQALLVLLGIGLVISPAPVEGIQHILSITAVFALMVYFARARSDGPALYWLAIVSGVTSLLVSLAFLVWQGRLPDFNPNSFTYVPLTGLFAICLAFPFVERPGRQARLVLLAVANLMAVFLSHSRGGMLIGLGCALFVTTSLRGFRSRLTAVVATVLLVVAASVEFTDVQQLAIHRVRKLLDPHASLTERTSGRVDLLLGGWYLFTEHPWVGVGTGGFSNAWRDLPDVEGVSRFRSEPKAAHAGWIKTLAENGVVGGALLLAYVLSFGVIGRRVGDRSLRRLGLLTTVVLGLAFVSTEFQMKGLWFLAAGTTVFLGRGAARGPSDRRQATDERGGIA